jgi:hypothetical protein
MKQLPSAAVALTVSLAVTGASLAQPTTEETVRQVCAGQFEKLCPGVDAGGGALRKCARAHFFQFTGPCRNAMMHMRKPAPGEGSAAGGSPPPKP